MGDTDEVQNQSRELEEDERTKLGLQAGRVFTPAAPVNKRTLFAGRTEQVRRVIDAINQRGQHIVIYGERGVGKTSMANVLSDFLQTVPTERLEQRWLRLGQTAMEPMIFPASGARFLLTFMWAEPPSK